jgi:hypothetical protein
MAPIALARPPEQQVVGVDDADDGYGQDVVDNGNGQQEQLHAGRHAVAEQSEHADGERDVGSHRDGPAVGGRGRRSARLAL